MCHCLCVQYWKTKQNRWLTLNSSAGNKWRMELLWKSWVPLLSSIGFWKTQQQNIPKPISVWLEQNANLPRKVHSEGFRHPQPLEGRLFLCLQKLPHSFNSQLCAGNSLLPLSIKMGLDGSPVWPKLAKPHWDVDQLEMQKTPVPFLICSSWSWPPHFAPCSHVESRPWSFYHKGLNFTARRDHKTSFRNTFPF